MRATTAFLFLLLLVASGIAVQRTLYVPSVVQSQHHRNSNFPAGLPLAPLLDNPALVCYLGFQEGSGNTASGSGYTWTMNDPSKTNWVDGKFGNALEFVAYGGFVQTPYASSFDLPTFSIAMWLNHTSTKSSMNLYTHYDGGPDRGIYIGFCFYSVERGRPYARIFDGATHDMRINATTDIRDGQWHHLIVTYDGSELSLYVDNVLESSDSWAYTLAYATENPTLGAEDWGGYWYEGMMDELYIFSKVLTASERKTLYEWG